MGAQIFLWRPEDRPLLLREWAVVALWVVADSLLIGRYARNTLAKSQRQHYGAANLVGHFLGGATMCALAPVGLLLQASLVSLVTASLVSGTRVPRFPCIYSLAVSLCMHSQLAVSEKAPSSSS
jgi:hypothetical protein